MSLAATSPTVIVALIGAGASLLVALLTGFFTFRTSTKVKKLEEERAEKDAQRAYQYEARKRLYTVCEPVLFQATEQAEYAASRIRSLARSARQGELSPDGRGWLSTPQRYYFRSIAYGLLAPLTGFTTLQRYLTTIDLKLDPIVRRRYELIKLIFLSLSEDWELARQPDGELEYDRNRADPGEPDRERLLSEYPQRYAPQGLYRGTIYVVAEALTTASAPSAGGSDSVPPRCVSFGEFERAWAAAGANDDTIRAGAQLEDSDATPSPLAPIYGTVVELFQGFHPSRKPVLWRVLTYQYMLYRALLSAGAEFEPLTAEELQALSWQGSGEVQVDQTLSIVQTYASKRLDLLPQLPADA